MLIYAIVLGYFGFPQMGVVGFALSSVAYYFTINIILLAFTLWQRELRQIWKTPVVLADCSFSKLIRFAKSGLPIAFNFVSDLFILSVIGLSISTPDVRSIGAHSLAFNMLEITLVGTSGMALALSILVVQSSSNKNQNRVGAIAVWCLIFSLMEIPVPSVLIGLFPRYFLQLYEPDAALMLLTGQLVQLIPWLLIPLTINCVTAFMLRGLSAGCAVMLIYLIVSWLLWFPLGYTLAFTNILTSQSGVVGWW